MFKHGVVVVNLTDIIALAILGAAVVAVIVLFVVAFVQNRLKERKKRKAADKE